MIGLPTIAVLGATGQVGWELCRTLSVLGRVIPVSRSGSAGERYDLTRLSGVSEFLSRISPDAIINAAAFTAVDKAESERDLAFCLNAHLPELLGAWAAPRNVPIVHFSTDYVFDGAKAAPYSESDLPAPLNVYGESKLAGDMALVTSPANVWILRVGWVYGTRGHNFLLTMQRLMRDRDVLRIVADQTGAPTWCRSIAEATNALLVQLLRHPERMSGTAGIYHLPSAGQASWYEFAEYIRALVGLECKLEPVSTAEYPTPARRPLNSLMDGAKVLETFGVVLPDWRRALEDCLAARG
jgi:dTDP-4-dehydrorhamnose reductase